MNEIKPYPKPLDPKDRGYSLLKPEVDRALAEAYRSRLVVAVEALQRLSLGSERWNADEALSAIGEIPE